MFPVACTQQSAQPSIPPPPLHEIFTVDFTGKTPSDLLVVIGECKYFLQYGDNLFECVFFRVNGSGDNPNDMDVSHPINISLTDTAADMAQACVDDAHNVFGFDVTRSGAIAIFTNQSIGDAGDAVDVTTGLTITVTQQGIS